MDWRDGYVKLFMSHIAEHKALVGEVAEELIDRGIHGFVAHNDISPSRSWEDEIEEALQTCDAMAAFLHEGFKESHWTDQEVGFCLARDVKIIPLRFDLNPYGSMGRYQAAPSRGKTAREIGDLVLDALLDDSRTQRKAEDGIISSLKDSQQFKEANKRAEYLDRIEDFNVVYRLEALQEALRNAEVQGGYAAKPKITRILDEFPIDQAPPF